MYIHCTEYKYIYILLVYKTLLKCTQNSTSKAVQVAGLEPLVGHSGPPGHMFDTLALHIWKEASVLKIYLTMGDLIVRPPE